jgi:hypothetical protein
MISQNILNSLDKHKNKMEDSQDRNDAYTFIPQNSKILNYTKISEYDESDVLIIEEYIDPFLSEDFIKNFKVIICRQKIHKSEFLCVFAKSYFVYVNMSMLPFKVLSYQLDHGNLGVFNQLGYVGICDENIVTHVITDENDVNTLSAHAPSKVVIETNKEFLLRGYCSLTSKIYPNITFKCDGDIIGTTNSSCVYTVWYTLLPGTHELVVETSDTAWAHSVWMFKEIKPIDKYIKIDFNTTGWGLFNQLISFTNSIIIANQANRHIYDPRVLVNYNSFESIPISSVIDIDGLNQVLKSLNIHTRIVNHNKIINWTKSLNYDGTTLISNHLPIICNNISSQNTKYLNTGNMFNLTLQKSEYISNIERQIFCSLPFTPRFYEILNYCKEHFLTDNYSVVHLRLEDDWINFSKHDKNFTQHSEDLFGRYLDKMNETFESDDKIYLATHLLKSSNVNNSMVDRIKDRYKNLVPMISWRDVFDMPVGREIDALVDYIICINANKFIGTVGSTFSAVICQVLSHKQKVFTYI